MNAFIDYLSSFVQLSENTQAAINTITIPRKVPKGTLLLSAGQICTEFHFIASGIARAFYYKDGKDVTAWFASENEIVSAVDSLFTGNKSNYNIEIIEDSIVFSLQYDLLEPVFRAYPEVERLGRLMITHNYQLLDERMRMYSFCSAEERYESLIRQFPNVIKRVKLSNIASYIGISQEHLSRIRASK